MNKKTKNYADILRYVNDTDFTEEVKEKIKSWLDNRAKGSYTLEEVEKDITTVYNEVEGDISLFTKALESAIEKNWAHIYAPKGVKKSTKPAEPKKIETPTEEEEEVIFCDDDDWDSHEYVPFTWFYRKAKVPEKKDTLDLYKSNIEELYLLLLFCKDRRDITAQLKEELLPVEYDNLKTMYCNWLNENIEQKKNIDLFNPPDLLIDERYSESKPLPPKGTSKYLKYVYDGICIS